MTDPQPIPFLNPSKKVPPPAPAHKNYAGDDPTIDNDTNLLHRAHKEIDRLHEVIENHLKTIFEHQKTIDELKAAKPEVPPKAEAQDVLKKDDEVKTETEKIISIDPVIEEDKSVEVPSTAAPASVPTILVPKVPVDAKLENNS